MAQRDRPWLRSYPPDVPDTLEAAIPIAPMAKRFTYRGLVDEAERFARALQAMGVKKGDRVGLVLPNCPQFVIAFYAIQRLGA